MTDFVQFLDQTVVYRGALYFFGFYPVFMALVWVVMSVIYWFRRERTPQDAEEDVRPAGEEPYEPMVSIVIPAFAEEQTIEATVRAALEVDYPNFEVVVVNDGSPDATADLIRQIQDEGPRKPVRLVDKEVNEGKAMAINDAVPVCRGEILVVTDADVHATPGLLQAIVPHFAAPRVGAVTGNPRVVNRDSLLKKLQAIEFSSIISVQRRAQRIWGRVLTCSGAIMALRKSALLDVGGFRPEMATEDIDLTWRLQKKFWDVRYAAEAVVWMSVPRNLRELWRQRKRWSRGLAQVLLRHWKVPFVWVYRRLWPVFYESVASIAWSFSYVFVIGFWLLCAAVGHVPFGLHESPHVWIMVVATASLLQLLVGVLLDRRYDRHLLREYRAAILYPMLYWALLSTITAIYSFRTLFGQRERFYTWSIERG